jgi:PAS domain S-box-containing protein
MDGTAFGDAVQRANYPLERLLQALPAAIYATDAVGRITFYNDAAAKLWGCRPELGNSEFCGSWKLYWPDGRPMAHHQCPMAVALREQREIRGLEAMAERPDGSFVQFMPYPTPLFDSTGVLIGAVNMLVDISDRKRADIRPTACINCRNIGRRHCQQGPQRHHHKLEWRRRAVVRLHGCGGPWQAGDTLDSPRPPQ